jgi:hypothetical protein
MIVLGHSLSGIATDRQRNSYQYSWIQDGVFDSGLKAAKLK